jgi:hypothetical protein
MTIWRDIEDNVHCVYSQNGEDGVLDTIFANIGETNRYLLDVGAGDGMALSNTRLFLDRGWHGARFDANYAADVNQERITAENVCDILAKYNVPCEPDLLSLDIDGNDWYVLRALFRGGFFPRVICCEFNPDLPAEPPVAIVYDPAHDFDHTRYYGASLGAYRRLAEAHGYSLVYVLANYNAFFVAAELVPADAVIEWNFEVGEHWPLDPQQRPWHPITDEECK